MGDGGKYVGKGCEPDWELLLELSLQRDTGLVRVGEAPLEPT